MSFFRYTKEDVDAVWAALWFENHAIYSYTAGENDDVKDEKP